jgi:phage terminase small subunit
MTPKRAKFVSEYLKDFNGAQAAVRAGYSRKTARAIANNLLTTVDISAAVAAERDKVRSAAILTLTEAQEIASLAARGDSGNAKWRDRLTGLDRMAKFNGWDKPAQLDVTSGGQPLRTEIVMRPREPEPPDADPAPNPTH